MGYSFLVSWFIIGALFLLYGAPFLGALFLFFMTALYLIMTRFKKEPTLPKIYFPVAKITLALTFLGGIGLVLSSYINEIKCFNCMQGIRKAMAVVPFQTQTEDMVFFFKEMHRIYPRTTTVYLLLGGFFIFIGLLHFILRFKFQKPSAPKVDAVKKTKEQIKAPQKGDSLSKKKRITSKKGTKKHA